VAANEAISNCLLPRCAEASPDLLNGLLACRSKLTDLIGELQKMRGRCNQHAELSNCQGIISQVQESVLELIEEIGRRADCQTFNYILRGYKDDSSTKHICGNCVLELSSRGEWCLYMHSEYGINGVMAEPAFVCEELRQSIKQRREEESQQPTPDDWWNNSHA
jgi:hypothetical protein